MRQLHSQTVVRPTTTNQTHREWSGFEATVGFSGAFLPTSVARARATCRIDGDNFLSVFPSSSLQHAATPTVQLFYFLSFPSTRIAFSGAARALVSLRLLPALVDWGASCQPRARQTPEQVPRSIEEKCHWRDPNVRWQCHGSTWRSRWGEATKNVRGNFLKNETWLLPPRSSRLHGAYLVYRNYFSLFCFSFHSRKAAPTRPDQPPVFRPAILH